MTVTENVRQRSTRVKIGEKVEGPGGVREGGRGGGAGRDERKGGRERGRRGRERQREKRRVGGERGMGRVEERRGEESGERRDTELMRHFSKIFSFLNHQKENSWSALSTKTRNKCEMRWGRAFKKRVMT